MMGLILDDGLALDEQMKRIALDEGYTFRLFSSTSVMRGLHVALDWPSIACQSTSHHTGIVHITEVMQVFLNTTTLSYMSSCCGLYKLVLCNQNLACKCCQAPSGQGLIKLRKMESDTCTCVCWHSCKGCF